MVALSGLVNLTLFICFACATAITDVEYTNEITARSNINPPTIEISGATLTSKWFEGSRFIQVLEMNITNTDSSNYLTESHGLTLRVDSDSLDTAVPGTVIRLAPHQSQIVQVGVTNQPGVQPGTQCNASIIVSYGQNITQAAASVIGACGIGDYEASDTSLNHHSSPDWYNDAKYGIFIHWGIYAAPAYGNVGPDEGAAEWYWFWMHDPSYVAREYQYHEETYGETFNYDDFMSNFTIASFDPKEWVDLIADAGAQYFVPTTKHHDGFALFNFSSSISQRSSVHYGPKTDIIGMLMAAAKLYQPQLRRGTYFSLPEWYNPAYAEYPWDPWGNGIVAFPGGPPKNPYTNEVVPYTGYVEVEDFILDIQLPQMRQLAYEYETELMWCDPGGANNGTIFAADWLNWARDQGRQVTFNDRCGLTGDFDTPEHTTNSETVARKWESCDTLDPGSWGYNYVTPDGTYRSGEWIVASLVDIVSKNGNFLLNMGPEHDGSIKQIMQDNLRDAGQWIKAHGESLFGTRYWSVTPGSDPLRYTTTSSAFYIHYIGTPPSTINITDPIPYLPGDIVTVLGGSKNGTSVPVTWDGIGTLNLILSSDIISADKYVWTFKIGYSAL